MSSCGSGYRLEMRYRNCYLTDHLRDENPDCAVVLVSYYPDKPNSDVSGTG
jgi:hypothetical protein